MGNKDAAANWLAAQVRILMQKVELLEGLLRADEQKRGRGDERKKQDDDKEADESEPIRISIYDALVVVADFGKANRRDDEEATEEQKEQTEQKEQKYEDAETKKTVHW